jgi:hypothetical protein
VKKSALISQCGKYRYSLTRDWYEGDGEVVFVLLNPSTADHYQDDPTVRRCIGFAKSWGKSSLKIVNLFAFRSVQPTALLQCEDAIGPENDHHIVAACRKAVTTGTEKNSPSIICAWGNHGKLFDRSTQTRKLLVGLNPSCFGLTAKKQPRHPLYLSATTTVEPMPTATFEV